MGELQSLALRGCWDTQSNTKGGTVRPLIFGTLLRTMAHHHHIQSKKERGKMLNGFADRSPTPRCKRSARRPPLPVLLTNRCVGAKQSLRNPGRYEVAHRESTR